MISSKEKNSNRKDLAIVIPAYKAVFFEQALISISEQTDKRFNVYLGDDCSPDNLKPICDHYRNHINIIYKRYEENFGSHSLVKHWNRCIRLSSEPYVWLFCDDDVMEPGCVESFYKSLEKDIKFEVCRFNTLLINAEGKILHENNPHPEFETGVQFAYERFCGRRMSFVSEYIFKRQSFEKEQGMMDFPMAWCSDDASWIAFTKNQKIYTIPGPKVKWRHSGINISSANAEYQKQKISALFQYLTWIGDKIESGQLMDEKIKAEELIQAARSWFFSQLSQIAPLGIGQYIRISKLRNNILTDFRLKDLFKLLQIDYKYFIKMI